VPSLRELQVSLRVAMLGSDDAVATEIVDDGIGASERLDVYRHHVLSSLTNVLASTYPVVVRLVGRRFFDYVADRFIRAHPPSEPCLFEYGAELPAFLAAFPACAHLEYLPDVARLEWAMHAALWAPDPSTEGRALPDPSCTLLRSQWPVHAIWRANQADADPDATVDLGAGGVVLEIRRIDDDVVLRRLA
jgi:hypothetical protein